MSKPSTTELRDELSALLFWRDNDLGQNNEKARLRLLNGWLSQHKKDAPNIFPLVKFKYKELSDEVAFWLIDLAAKNPNYKIDIKEVSSDLDFYDIAPETGFPLIASLVNQMEKKDVRQTLRQINAFFSCGEFSEKHKKSVESTLENIQEKLLQFGLKKEYVSFAASLSPKMLLFWAKDILIDELHDVVGNSTTFDLIQKELKASSPNPQKITGLINSLARDKMKQNELDENEIFSEMMNTALDRKNPIRFNEFTKALLGAEKDKVGFFIPDPYSLERFCTSSSVSKDSLQNLLKVAPPSYPSKLSQQILSRVFQATRLSDIPCVNRATKVVKSMSLSGCDFKKNSVSFSYDDLVDPFCKNPKKLYLNDKFQAAVLNLADLVHPSFGGVVNAVASSIGAKEFVPAEKTDVFRLNSSFKSGVRQLRSDGEDDIADTVQAFITRQEKLVLQKSIKDKVPEKMPPPKRKL